MILMIFSSFLYTFTFFRYLFPNYEQKRITVLAKVLPWAGTLLFYGWQSFHEPRFSAPSAKNYFGAPS